MRALIFALLVLSGCAGKPMTPEEMAFHKYDQHCSEVAEAAKAGLVAQQNQAGVVGGLYSGVVQSRQQRAAYNSAYRECMWSYDQEVD